MHISKKLYSLSKTLFKRFNPYFGWYKIYVITSAKVGINSCRCAREYFICTCDMVELNVTGWCIIAIHGYF